jgi:hypothetical protein
MVAHFESQMQLLGYRDVLHKELGLPFCVAASRGGQAARVAMELHGQGRLVWDCQRGSWQAWQAVAKPNPLAPAAVCEALDRDPNMPVRCKAAAVNGTATMTVRFSSTEVARPLFASMVEDVATPFCVGSVAGGRAGFVHLRYEASKRGRSYNCETGTWGEEYSTEPARANAAPASARGAAPVAPNARALRGNDTI